MLVLCEFGSFKTNSERAYVLEVETDAREVDLRLDANLAELLRVTNPGPLQDQWRAKGTR